MGFTYMVVSDRNDVIPEGQKEEWRVSMLHTGAFPESK